MTRHASFAPVVDERTEILILGSLPGVASLNAGRYYAHPRNQFWGLVGSVINADLESQDYQERLAILRRHGIGLWDVIADARRSGSLDAAIRDPAANDLRSLAASLPRLTTIGFNGGVAARIGTVALESSGGALRLVRLPSSSPAYTLPFATKLKVWRSLSPSKSS